ncbi:hypothetical protein D3C87_1375270 [compost metagenome]
MGEDDGALLVRAHQHRYRHFAQVCHVLPVDQVDAHQIGFALIGIVQLSTCKVRRTKQVARHTAIIVIPSLDLIDIPEIAQGA